MQRVEGKETNWKGCGRPPTGPLSPAMKALPCPNCSATPAICPLCVPEWTWPSSSELHTPHSRGGGGGTRKQGSFPSHITKCPSRRGRLAPRHHRTGHTKQGEHSTPEEDSASIIDRDREAERLQHLSNLSDQAGILNSDPSGLSMGSSYEGDCNESLHL